MTFHRIPPILNHLAETLANAATNARTGKVSPDNLAEMLVCSGQALQKLAPIVSELVKAEEDQSFALAGINDLALELLWSLNPNSQHYAPRPQAENVALLYDLMEYLPYSETVDNEDNVVSVNFRKEAGQ